MAGQSVAAQLGAMVCIPRDTCLEPQPAAPRERDGGQRQRPPGEPEVPGRTVCVLEGDGSSGLVEAAGLPRFGEQEEREETTCLRVGGVRPDDLVGERDGRPRHIREHQPVAFDGRMAKGVHDVDHRERIGQTCRVRGPQMPTGLVDAPLRPGEPGAHRGVLDVQRVRDGCRRQAAHEPEREWQPGVGRHYRLAGEEQELHPVVAGRRRSRCGRLGERWEMPSEGRLPPQLVDGDAPRGGHDPAGRIGDVVPGRRPDPRLLEGVFGELDAAELTYQAREEARPGARDLLVEPGRHVTWRSCRRSGTARRDRRWGTARRAVVPAGRRLSRSCSTRSPAP